MSAQPSDTPPARHAVQWPLVLGERRVGDRIELDLQVEPELVYFAGHFPAVPILAGVVQIHWAVALGIEHFGIAGHFQRMEVIKFKELIRPGHIVQLQLRFSTPEGRLQFTYARDGDEFSSGRVYFHDP